MKALNDSLCSVTVGNEVWESVLVMYLEGEVISLSVGVFWCL